MSKKSDGVDLNILNMEMLEPGEYTGKIMSATGVEKGEWKAKEYRSEREFVDRFELSIPQCEAMGFLFPSFRPIAFLENIRVEKPRRRGYGSKGLAEFEHISRARGLEIAIGRLAWPEPSNPEAQKRNNRAFYQKNGYSEYQLAPLGEIEGIIFIVKSLLG